MIKTLRECTAVTTEYFTFNSVMTNVPDIVSARSKQCYYALMLWIKIASRQERSVTPGGFTDAVLTEYRKLYHTNQELENKDTDKIVLNPDRFTKKMSFSKWYHQLDNFAGLLIGKAVDPIAQVMREDLIPLTGANIASLLTLHGSYMMVTHHSGTAYKSNSGNLWSLIRDRTEDGPAWARIFNFKTSCDKRSVILVLIKHYQVYA